MVGGVVRRPPLPARGISPKRFVARYAQTSDLPAVGRAGGARSHLAPGAVGSRSAPVGQFCDYASVRLRQCGRADRGRGFHGFSGYGRRGWAVRWEAHWHRLFSWFAVRTGLAKLPEGISWAILAAGGEFWLVLALLWHSSLRGWRGWRCWPHGRGARSEAGAEESLAVERRRR